MRIKDVIRRMAEQADLERRPKPVITVPKADIAQIAWALEADIGGRIYSDINPYNGFKFAGIEFRPC